MKTPVPQPEKRNAKSSKSWPQVILVPVDFSDASKAALEYAKTLARPAGGMIRLVHVLEPGSFIGHTTLARPDRSVVRELANRCIGGIQVEELAGFRTDFALREGTASEEIVTEADEAQASLIVMTTHGDTGLRRAMMGSTAERVVHTARCPVLVVRPPVEEDVRPRRAQTVNRRNHP